MAEGCSVDTGECFPQDAGMTLLESTKDLLARAKGNGFNLREIAEMSGGAVEYAWLIKFAKEKKNEGIKNPGVNTIQSLHDCLLKLKRKSS